MRFCNSKPNTHCTDRNIADIFEQDVPPSRSNPSAEDVDAVRTCHHHNFEISLLAGGSWHGVPLRRRHRQILLPVRSGRVAVQGSK